MEKVKLKNIKVKDYLQLETRSHYDIHFDYIKAKPELNGETANFTNLTFNQVSVLKRYYHKNNIESYQIVIDIFYTFEDEHRQKLFKIENVYIYEWVQFIKWISERMEEIAEREKELQSAPDAKLIAAGIEQMNKFGETNTKVELAEQFNLDPDIIGEWKYTKVFRLKHFNTVRSNIRKNIK